MPAVSDPIICDPSTGACLCKDNVDLNINTHCDTCLDGYWNISSPDGCQGIAAVIRIICVIISLQSVHAVHLAVAVKLVIRCLAIVHAMTVTSLHSVLPVWYILYITCYHDIIIISFTGWLFPVWQCL